MWLDRHQQLGIFRNSEYRKVFRQRNTFRFVSGPLTNRSEELASALSDITCVPIVYGPELFACANADQEHLHRRRS